MYRTIYSSDDESYCGPATSLPKEEEEVYKKTNSTSIKETNHYHKNHQSALQQNSDSDDDSKEEILVENRMYLTADVREDLQRRGYGNTYINTALMNLNQNEIVSLDIDMCSAMIESMGGFSRQSSDNSPSSSSSDNVVARLSLGPKASSQREIFDQARQSSKQTTPTTGSQPLYLIILHRYLDITIKPHSTLETIKLAICKKLYTSKGLSKHVNPDEIVLKLIADNDWCVDIDNDIDMADIPNPSRINASQLKSGDVIAFGSNFDSIRPRSQLSHLCNSYHKTNEIMRNKISALSKAYCGWRPIRGDGNCYYRAVIYGVLENAVLSPSKGRRRHVFTELYSMFYSLEFDSYGDDNDEHARRCHGETLEYLQAAADGKQAISWDRLEFEYLTDPHLDLSMIRCCRKLISDYIINNSDLDVNGITLADAILCTYSDVSDLSAYCKQYIDRMGVDAEGPVIDLGLLFQLFHTKGCTVYLDRREDVDVTMLSSAPVPSPSSSPPLDCWGQIYLLLRPGHYDLLYPNTHILNNPNPTVTSLRAQHITKCIITKHATKPSSTVVPESSSNHPEEARTLTAGAGSTTATDANTNSITSQSSRTNSDTQLNSSSSSSSDGEYTNNNINNNNTNNPRNYESAYLTSSTTTTKANSSRNPGIDNTATATDETETPSSTCCSNLLSWFTNRSYNNNPPNPNTRYRNGNNNNNNPATACVIEMFERGSMDSNTSSTTSLGDHHHQQQQHDNSHTTSRRRNGKRNNSNNNNKQKKSPNDTSKTSTAYSTSNSSTTDNTNNGTCTVLNTSIHNTNTNLAAKNNNKHHTKVSVAKL